MRPSVNPVLQYLRRHEWEWISDRTLAMALGMSVADIERALDKPLRMGSIDVSASGTDRRYRYIGNRSNSKRRVVEYLKQIYPNYASGAEIQSGADVYNAVGWIRSYADVMPIEMKRSNWVRKYRYIPNDIRSLAAGTVRDTGMHDIDHYECGYDLPCPYGNPADEDIDCSSCSMAVPVYLDGTYGGIGE